MTDEWRYQPPRCPWLSVLYEDADVIVLDKPAGLLSVPGRRPDRQDSLYTRVRDAHPGARVVHRLDMDTSGVMLFALNRPAERRLDKQFQARKVDKRYRARVRGQISVDFGIIDLPLARLRGQLRSAVDYAGGKVARSAYRVLSRDATSTRLAIAPQTGRSHQLRVHFATIGHPIVGDRFYAPPSMAERMLLHAHTLAFDQPVTGVRLQIAAPLPDGV
ncbi:MAG: RluA family pseudouridine synthase [Myxococcota bacterium]